MVALAAVVAVGAEIGYFLYRGQAAFHLAEAAALPPPTRPRQYRNDWPTSLFSEYLLPFEIASILLLVAVVGSVVMAKKRI